MKAYLVEVSLQEVHLLLILEKAGPKLELKFLLPEDELDSAVGVVGLAVLRVDLGEKIQRDAVCYTLAGGPLERDVAFSDGKRLLGLRNIRGFDVDNEVVALRVTVGGTLSPCHCSKKTTCQPFNLIVEWRSNIYIIPAVE